MLRLLPERLSQKDLARRSKYSTSEKSFVKFAKFVKLEFKHVHSVAGDRQGLGTQRTILK
jgi:hypothetical protein